MRLLLKLCKILIGLALVPLCAGAVLALWSVVFQSGAASAIWITVLAGACFWLLLSLLLPKPNFLYTLGHELTHGFYSFLSGGKLEKISVHSDEGYSIVTKDNFLVSLSPYFFPLYAVLAVAVFVVGNYFWDWTAYVRIFYFLIGFFYAFHLTITAKVLKIKQPDIVHEGFIFSAAVIFLGNVLVLLFVIPFLTHTATIPQAFGLWIARSAAFYGSLFTALFVK